MLKLWKHQQYAIEKYASREYFGLIFPCGCGKEQPLSSRILTEEGYIFMRDVKIGDIILDGKGNRCKISGIFPQGRKQVYKLTFSDSTSIRVGYEHLNRFVRHSRPVCHKCKDEGIRTMDIQTKDLIEQFNSKRYDFWCELPVCKFAGDYDPERYSLPMNPYLLGFLIGDGCLHPVSKSVFITENDLLNKVNYLVNQEDCKLTAKDSRGDYYITRNRSDRPNKIKEKIDNLGLNVKSVDKFIPNVYLFSSVKSRTMLLQGLFDTDGTVSTCVKGGCTFEYSTSSKRLAEDVAFLCRSLGLVVKVRERKPVYTYKGIKKEGHVSYRLFLKCPNGFPIVTSEKHLAKIKDRQASVPMRKLISIETDGFEDCQCIMVDSPEHTYITDNVTVTHNTLTAARIAELKDRPVIIIAPNCLCSQWKEELENHGDNRITEKDWNVVMCTSSERKTKRFLKAFNALKERVGGR